MMRRSLLAATLAAGLTSPTWAYYYYVHLTNSSAPFNPIVERFDLAALPNNTVSFFISTQGPSALAPGDSYQAIISEVRAAAEVWNEVPTSNLRLQYGGVFDPSSTDRGATPGIDVEFSDDVPPGLLALGGPTTASTIDSTATFVPITRSTLLLWRDMSSMQSWEELFFTTLVHELGHTMGLQHTTTSSIMSTAITTGMSRAHPLAADDMAGISLLYPTSGFAGATGSISGTVTFNDGTPVNLAAVVVISRTGEPVSAFTLPDGTYRIDGIPPGFYLVYAQPLPPPYNGESTNLNIRYPVDPSGASIPPNGFFTTQFYPGAPAWPSAAYMEVRAGQLNQAINFNVQRRANMPVNSIRTYGFVPTGDPNVNAIAVPSPPAMYGTATQTLVLSGPGLLDGNNAIENGISVGTLGTSVDFVTGSLRSYLSSNSVYYAAMDYNVAASATPGWKHLTISSSDDVYVLPEAMHVVMSPPPSIASVTVRQDGTMSIVGQNLTEDTRVFFDGIEARYHNFTSDNRIIVLPPVADPGYAARVILLDPDYGQSSLFLPTLTTYSYPGGGGASLSISPQSLTAGGETQVDVVGTNTSFSNGATSVGFGRADVVVNNVTVLSPTHLTATVTAPDNTNIPTSIITVTTDLSVLSPSLQ